MTIILMRPLGQANILASCLGVISRPCSGRPSGGPSEELKPVADKNVKNAGSMVR